MRLSFLLFGLGQWLKYAAWRYPSFRRRLAEKDLVAQIKLQDDSVGRIYTFEDGKVSSRRGIHPSPDVCMSFRTEELALKLLRPSRDPLDQINAMKNFQVVLEGDDESTYWFTETLSMMLNAGVEYGVDVGKGTRRYTTNTNGGPLFVYVKGGRIVRVTPIEFDGSDAGPWTVEARGKRFTPPRKTTVSPYTLSWKSLVYSPDRILYPMKRVDFNPHGARNFA